MQVHVTNEKLSHAVTRVEKVTGKNLSLAVLSGIYLEAKGKKLILRATNLDLGIEVSISAKVSKEGSVVVPGGTLSSFLSQSPQSENATLKTVGGGVVITLGSNEVMMKTYDKEEFPSLPDVPKENTLSLDAKKFAQGLKSVWYSASVSSMKPELSSVYVAYENRSLIFAATDSFRLAEKKISAKLDNPFDQLLIPLKNISEIIRNLEESDDVTVSFNENQLSLEIDDGSYITSRIIDGVFPDYKQIIPNDFETEVTLLKQDLVDALKVSNIFSNKFNQVVFEVKPKEKAFTINTQNPELGESSVAVDSALSGEEIEIGFNHKYISDVFSSIDTDSITLKLAGAGKPMVIEGVGDATFTYLVMPMNR